jgi:hypothetical protein
VLSRRTPAATLTDPPRSGEKFSGAPEAARAVPDLCEHTFVTSQGSAFQRFRRAIATGNLTIIRAEAAELPRIGLAEAAAILLVIADRDPDSYDRAAIRWLGKLCHERTEAGLADVARAAQALTALRAEPAGARAALAELCARAGVADAAAVFRGA